MLLSHFRMIKNYLRFFFLCAVVFTSQAHGAVIKSSAALPRPSDLPPLATLEEAALRRAGLDPKIIQRWEKKSRLSAALPTLQVGFENKDLQQNTAIIQDSISVTSSGVAIGPESNRVDQDISLNRGFEFKAVWALNELLFNRDELEVSREARDLLIVRRGLVEELHQNYFELKSQLLKMQTDAVLSQDPFARMRTEQLMERLDSLTGGTFKRLLKERNNDPSKIKA